MAHGLDAMSFTELMDRMWFNGKERAWEMGGRPPASHEPAWRAVLRKRRESAQPVLRAIQRCLFNEPVRGVVMMLHVLCSMLYGYHYSVATLDALLLAILVFWAAEVLLRALTTDPEVRAFWYARHDVFFQAENRFDAVASLGPLLAFVIYKMVAGGGAGFGAWPEPGAGGGDLGRIILLLPLLRVFTMVRAVKRNFLGLVISFEVLVDQLAISGLVMYSFTAFACLFFSGAWRGEARGVIAWASPLAVS
jgi:hypothetical protein